MASEELCNCTLNLATRRLILFEDNANYEAGLDVAVLGDWHKGVRVEMEGAVSCRGWITGRTFLGLRK